MCRSLASLTLLVLSAAGCNDHPLVGVEYDHYTGGALGGGTDSGSGGLEDTIGTGGASGGSSGSSTAGTTSTTSTASTGTWGASDGGSTGGRPYCGDGEVDDGEACDDADMNGAPGFCSADCQSQGPQ